MAASLTEEELRELERLAAKATPGPWEVAKAGPSVWRGPLAENSTSFTRGGDREAGPLFDLDADNYTDRARTAEGAERLALRDGQLICAMRNALPALLKAARAVRNVEKLRHEWALKLASNTTAHEQYLECMEDAVDRLDRILEALTATAEPTAGEER